MDAILQVKAWARDLRDQNEFGWLKLSHGQALEMVVTLTTTAKSWNHYSASPLPPGLPVTINDYCGAVTRGQRRLYELGAAPSSDRGGRSYVVMHFLAWLTNSSDPFLLPWQLLDKAGTNVPIFSGVAPEEMQRDPEPYFIARLGDWFFRKHLGTELEYGNYPWDHTEKQAIELGFSPNDASLIREAQREAPNHSWELLSWWEVGVLDPDQRAFLSELQAEPRWQARFEKQLRTDDGRVADENEAVDEDHQ